LIETLGLELLFGGVLLVAGVVAADDDTTLEDVCAGGVETAARPVP